jgi:signal transduction histidine kinase
MSESWIPLATVGLGLAATAAGGLAAWQAARRRRAEAAEGRLAGRVEQLREILASAPDGLYLWDRIGGGEVCSRRLAALLGFGAGTAARFDDLCNALRPADGDALAAAVAALRESGVAFELPVATDDGRAFRATGSRAAGVDGRPLSDLLWLAPLPASATPADDPGPVEAEPPLPLPAVPAKPPAVVSTASADGAATVDAFPVLDLLATAVAIYGPDRRLRYVNPAFARLWTLDRAWLDGRPTLSQVLERQREMRQLPEMPDFRAFREREVARFAGQAAPEESLMHLPDGTTLRTMVAPHPGGGLVYTWQNLTERLNLERSVNTLAAVQRATLDNLYEGVAVFGGDGRLALWNPAFARLWKLEAVELESRPHLARFADLMRPLLPGAAEWPDGEWARHRERVVGTIIARKPRTGGLLRTDGTFLDYANVPLPDGAMLLSYIDVTDSVRVEQALRQRAEALAAADRLKSEFIADVSYEVRTPLTAVIGFAEVLANEYFGGLNHRQADYVRGILDASRSLSTLIADILDLAGIEAGLVALELDTLDLHTTLAGVLALVREQARHRKLKLEFDCPPDIGWLVADEKRLRQVLFNLLANAVRFTPAGGTVGLSARRADGTVEIAVADTGIGIPEADQARVFESFQRGRTPEGGQGGPGLGLTLVKRFVEMHGGTVALESAPGQGTRVTCRFPAG